MGKIKNRFYSLILILLMAVSFVPNINAWGEQQAESAAVESTAVEGAAVEKAAVESAAVEGADAEKAAVEKTAVERTAVESIVVEGPADEKLRAASGKAKYTAPVKKRVKTGLSDIPEYSGEEYYVINDNIPYFTKSNLSVKSKEKYGKLDKLGRCTECFSVIGLDVMPTEKRGNISSVKPSGWKQAQYDCVNGGSLYNRCHLIGYQLTAENANRRNLITGTRYMNEAMIPFENMAADYIRETGNHVLYRVRCLYNGDDLVARGITVEAWSVEDNGEGICFNVFFYNVQPGVVIDYADGSSHADENMKKTDGQKQNNDSDSQKSDSEINSSDEEVCDYIANAKTKVLHCTDCHSVKQMSDKNKIVLKGKKSEFIAEGYSPCKNCM